jgi:hypothetical protein
MDFVPRCINWSGNGKSRLSTVSFPDVVESDYVVDEHREQRRAYSIRQPISLKNCKKQLPVLVVPKRRNIKE